MLMTDTSVPVITIDGPGGTGKGTLCHALARALNWHCLDSGAIYRVYALAAEKNHLSVDSPRDQLISLATHLNISFDTRAEHAHHALLNGKAVSKTIRSEHCGQMASQFAAIPELRLALLERQRKFAQLPGLVTDGRDMGTVVFPHAVLKIFLSASVKERAKRRLLQLQQEENHVSLEQVVEELTKRDERDENRSVAPLKAASDAVVIDTSTKSIGEVLEFVLQLAKNQIL
jgi:cytidylate kinase